MNMPPPKVVRRIRQLHAMLGSPNANEATVAREKLNRLLAEYALTWNDLSAILAAADPQPDPYRTAPQQAARPEINVLDLVLRLVEQHIAVTPNEQMAIALWVLHTYVYDTFLITPRLALLSPVRGCGKTTLLAFLELLTHQPHRSDDVTPAAIYHYLNHRPNSTLMVDEADNLGLLDSNSPLRRVFNSGHRRGGNVTRFVGGWSQKFPTFAPLAIAAIGTLPLPLMHRSVVISMQRSATQLERLDEFSPVFPAAREQINKWVATSVLAQDPAMPSELQHRMADNWRVLLAIADDLGHGDAARAAAVALCADRPDEDYGVLMLRHIQGIFLAREIDRILSSELVDALIAIDDAPWHDWRGPRDDRSPRKLTQSDLAWLLRPFGIRPRTVRGRWGTARGYYRHQFERAWRAYCDSADTPTQSSKVRYLHQK
jgi:uncharacterized protein DUF3631